MSRGRGQEERAASSDVLSTDLGFTGAVHSGEEMTEPLVGGTMRQAAAEGAAGNLTRGTQSARVLVLAVFLCDWGSM